MDKAISCSFTGHRINKLPWGGDESDERCIHLKNLMYDAAEAVCHAGIRHFICGMANGCDMYFCEAVLRLREERPEITLEAAIPWTGQSRSWTPELRARYDRLVSDCDVRTVLSENYFSGCMQHRNKYMVDNSSVLIAAYDGRSGGTQSTILYAMRSGLEIIQLPIG